MWPIKHHLHHHHHRSLQSRRPQASPTSFGNEASCSVRLFQSSSAAPSPLCFCCSWPFMPFVVALSFKSSLHQRVMMRRNTCSLKLVTVWIQSIQRQSLRPPELQVLKGSHGIQRDYTKNKPLAPTSIGVKWVQGFSSPRWECLKNLQGTNSTASFYHKEALKLLSWSLRQSTANFWEEKKNKSQSSISVCTLTQLKLMTTGEIWKGDLVVNWKVWLPAQLPLHHDTVPAFLLLTLPSAPVHLPLHVFNEQKPKTPPVGQNLKGQAKGLRAMYARQHRHRRVRTK